MGKKKSAPKKQAASSASSSDGAGAKTEITKTVEKLVEQGTVASSNMELELAQQFYSRALSMDPTNTSVMDALADIYMQLGSYEEAMKALLSSCQAAPNSNPTKWLFLGQLQCGLEALESYSTAIEILRGNIEHTKKPEEVNKQVAKAYCSISELYLTDLCFEEGAERKCEEAVNSAIAMDPTGLDGRQTLASLRLSQCRKKEAAIIITGVFETVTQIRMKQNNRTVLEELREKKAKGTEMEVEEEDEGGLMRVELDFCTTTVKMLIECASEDGSLIEKAIELIQDLMNEDDESIELWYLMGVALGLTGDDPDQESIRYHFETAREMIEASKATYPPEQEFPFEGHYETIMNYLQSADLTTILTPAVGGGGGGGVGVGVGGGVGGEGGVGGLGGVGGGKAGASMDEEYSDEED